MSGPIPCVQVTWTDQRLPQTFASRGALEALAQDNKGFDGAMRHLLKVVFAAALDPDPSKYFTTRLDKGSVALTLFGVELVLSGGQGSPLVVLLLAELPAWAAEGSEVVQGILADVHALAKAPSGVPQ